MHSFVSVIGDEWGLWDNDEDLTTGRFEVLLLKRAYRIVQRHAAEFAAVLQCGRIASFQVEGRDKAEAGNPNSEGLDFNDDLSARRVYRVLKPYLKSTAMGWASSGSTWRTCDEQHDCDGVAMAHVPMSEVSIDL